MQETQNFYISAFLNLKTDKSKSRWDEQTTFRAPHKPLLLLTILDLFAEGEILSNLIELTSELGDLFAGYWSMVKPLERERGNIAMPFYHLKSDGFWHLLPRPGYELILEKGPRIHAISKLKETTFGARLDDELYELMQNEESRNILRTILIEKYFALELRDSLMNQAKINLKSYLYSQELIRQVRNDLKVQDWIIESYGEKDIRDQGFRRAIVKVYDHRCAICGIRIMTEDGHTAVQAAHIIPWSVSHNDDPRNGLALCPLCHWTFDRGLVCFSDDYYVKISPRLLISPNLPGQILAFTDRKLLAPNDAVFIPFVESIQWHRKVKFGSP